MSREELRRLLAAWHATIKPYGFRLRPSGEYHTLARAAVGTLPDLLDQLDAAEARLAAVRELHRPVGRFGYCATCAYAIYPCPTVRALDGRADA